MFSKDNQPKGRGRPKGSRNKRSLIDEATQEKAKSQLQDAVEAGEQWAILAVLDRIMPKLKPITPTGSLDGDLLAAKIKEVAEFEERLAALEAQANEQK